MAAAFRDLDPALRSRRRPARLVDGLQMTSLVGMVDPPRAESKQAVEDAQSAHIRVRMVTGDDVVTGAAIAKQLGHRGRGDPRRGLRRARRVRAAVADRPDRRRRPRGPRAQGPAGRHAEAEGRGRRDDRRRRQRRARRSRPPTSGSRWAAAPRSPRTPGRMILTDDNFATIVHAVEQGRKLYDNLMKYVRFVLISLVAFVLTFLGATLLNIAAGQPFTAAAGALDPLLHQRAVRRRARPGPGDPGPDASPPAAERRVDHDRGRQAHRRASSACIWRSASTP